MSGVILFGDSLQNRLFHSIQSLVNLTQIVVTHLLLSWRNPSAGNFSGLAEAPEAFVLKPDVEIASGHGFLALALPYAKKSERFPPSKIFLAGKNFPSPDIRKFRMLQLRGISSSLACEILRSGVAQRRGGFAGIEKFLQHQKWDSPRLSQAAVRGQSLFLPIIALIMRVFAVTIEIIPP